MNIFISGIGGAGLGPLAEIALDAGDAVFGSDLAPSLQTAELEKRGVKIFYEQNADNLAKIHRENHIDWLIYTSALPDDAPELQFARANHIKFSKRDEFLAEFIRRKNLSLVAVAGTHGKTTTTAMLVWVFQNLNMPISYSVGATLPFANSGHYDKNSRFFVYEADEYDRNFLHFSPAVAAIVSLDYDHADIYKTVASYRAAFREFVAQSGQLVTFASVAEQLKNPPKNSVILPDGATNFNEIQLPGAATRDDAKLAMETLRLILDDFDESKIREILSRFPGTSRRFEKLAENLYTDYAHHPTEIAATLQKAREIAGARRKVVAVYQPHQNLRQREIVADGGYGKSFADADEIFWTPTYLVRGDLTQNSHILTSAELIETLDEKSRKVARTAELNDELFAEISRNLKKGNLIVVMGAGPIDAWLRGELSRG